MKSIEEGNYHIINEFDVTRFCDGRHKRWTWQMAFGETDTVLSDMFEWLSTLNICTLEFQPSR